MGFYHGLRDLWHPLPTRQHKNPHVIASQIEAPSKEGNVDPSNRDREARSGDQDDCHNTVLACFMTYVRAVFRHLGKYCGTLALEGIDMDVLGTMMSGQLLNLYLPFVE